MFARHMQAKEEQCPGGPCRSNRRVRKLVPEYLYVIGCKEGRLDEAKWFYEPPFMSRPRP